MAFNGGDVIDQCGPIVQIIQNDKKAIHCDHCSKDK